MSGRHKGAAQPRATGSRPSLAASSQAALAAHASYFGIKDPASELRQYRSTSRGGAGDIVRYRQLHGGIPVIGGELVLSLNGAGQLNSLSGEVARNLELASLQPAITAGEAQRIALAAMAKHYPDQRFSLSASRPELSVYDPALIGPDSGIAARLVWRFEVSAATDVREQVLVDAIDGSLRLHFSQIETALRLSTHTSNGTGTLPGTLLCNETQPLCTNGTNADADAAHRYSRETYEFYLTRHGRDSIDNLGRTLISSVNHLYSGCPNAFWNGTQMVYCNGAAQADDVVGHELTHAVTQYSSNLIYYYQAGAINESLSDLWGEFIDLTNGAGNDSPAVRWLLAEDYTALGPIRNMANPPQFGDPDRMRSPLYWNSSADAGGVHINSGVNNKAVTLMVDGGRFNGTTVVGIGIDKVAALYYRVQTQHLTSGSDYADLYLALNQACVNMIGGPEGIVAADCQQVGNATTAVEMNLTPLAQAGSEAAVCEAGQVPVNLLYDSAETSNDFSRWTVARLTGTAGSWSYGPNVGVATAGKGSYYTPGVNGVSNYALTLAAPVVLPANAFLHLRHLFIQEQGAANVYYDGGLIEYSTDGGVTWNDASALYSAGRNYTGVLATGFGNPAEGRNAFVGSSGGFLSTRYNLGSLANQSVQIRFRNTSDSSGVTGDSWYIDEVRLYTCDADTAGNAAPVASAGADQTVAPAVLVTLDGSASSDADGYLTATQWTQLSGTQVAITEAGRSMTFTAPLTPAQEQLGFRLTVTDNRGAVSSDDVTVTVVSQQPVANAGADQARKPRDTVTLMGSATDADGTIATYQWTQTSGPAVSFGKVFNTSVLVSVPGGIWVGTGPIAVGTSVMEFFFVPNGLSNAGGTVSLQPGSIYATCTFVSGNSCGWQTGSQLALTGAVTAPVTTDTSQPRTWTLQNVQLSNGAPVTGSFVFNANTFALTNIRITAQVATSNTLQFLAPSVPDSTALTFRLTSTDNAGGTGSDDVTVSVTNLPPTVNAGADKAVKPRNAVQLAGTAADTDGGVASVSWTQTSGPAVVLTNASTTTASFVAPSVVANATLAFRLTATDIDGAVTTDEVNVVVTNLAPTANAGADQSSKPRLTVQLAGVAGDPDGGTPGVQWTQVSGPAVALVNATSATASFVAPSVVASGTVVLRMTVTDIDGASAADDITITLTNLAPTASAGADQSSKPRATVQLAGVAVDPDGSAPTVLWSQVSGPAVTLANAASATTSFVAPSVLSSGTVLLKMTVTDIDGAVASDEVSVILANSAPLANAGPNKTVKAGKSVTLEGGGTDADGLISSYSWAQTSGPAVSLSGGNTRTAKFDAPSASTPSTLMFALTVTDNDGAASVDLVTVDVEAQSAGGGGGWLDVTALAALLALLAVRAGRRTIALRRLR